MFAQCAHMTSLMPIVTAQTNRTASSHSPSVCSPHHAHVKAFAAPQWQRRRCVSANVAAAERTHTASGAATQAHDNFLAWLTARGVQQDAVTTHPVDHGGYVIDSTVAARDIKDGEVILRVPEHLVVTLNSIFEDEAVAELLTTGKLSELAVLTLYLMYEKKEGKKSKWYEYIKELDQQRARGQQGAKSPLLWEAREVEQYLAGSPVQTDIRARLQGIEKEYGELDTVWFMAGSLFGNYPYDTPTDAFPLKLFREAFAAVQSSVVHMQGVPVSQRFALVPLGPPLLTYSPTAKALLRFDPERREVSLTADRDYQAGERILAWCGPQPNSRLLVNYGIVEDDNPYDKLQLTATIPHSDPLFQAKRAALQPAGLATQQTFNITAAQGLPDNLLPYLRLAHAESEVEVSCCSQGVRDLKQAKPLSQSNEREALHQLAEYIQMRLGRYQTTAEQDEALIADSSAKPRKRVAARLIRIEKKILNRALEQVAEWSGSRVEELDRHSSLTSALHSVKLT